MPGMQREIITGAIKSRLRLNHLPAGVAIITPVIFPQMNQFWGSHDPNQRFLKLLPSIGMAIQEPRQIPVGESGLLPGDGGNGDLGIGDDPFAIFPSDAGVVVEPF